MRILVVGGGLAGIASALRLQTHHQVTLVEARSRLGGRVHSVKEENDTLDMGAHWLHGTHGHPLAETAKHLNLMYADEEALEQRIRDVQARTGQTPSSSSSPSSSSNFPCCVFIENGSMNEYACVADVAQAVMKRYDGLLEECDNVYRRGQGVAQGDDSLGAYLHDHRRDDAHAQSSLYDRLWLWRDALEHAEVGCERLEDVSLAAWGEYAELEGADTPLRAFGAIVDQKVRQLASDRTTVLLDWPVKTIVYSHEGVSLQATDGRTLKGDCALVTLPLGVLKRHHLQMFSPVLPESKQHAIERMGWGDADRFFLVYPSLESMPRCAHNSLDIALVWNGTAARSVMRPQWLEHTHSIVGVRSLPILEVWLSGQGPQLFAEWRASHPQPEQLVQVMHSILAQTPGVENIPPCIDDDLSVRVLCSSWCTDPFTLGAYSYVPCALSTDTIDTLAAPVQSDGSCPRLFFAGEATHRTYYSTTHGAWLSGERAAAEICAIENSVQ